MLAHLGQDYLGQVDCKYQIQKGALGSFLNQIKNQLKAGLYLFDGSEDGLEPPTQ